MSLDRLLSPTSIAIAGISADSSKHGGRVLGHLRRLGYQGPVSGVNPGLPQIDGIDVYATVADIPEPPDVVVCATPSVAALEIVRSCRGVGAAIIFAGGFNEAGGAGRVLQAELRDAADQVGVRILGPNSGGLIRCSKGVGASFLTCLDRPADQIREGAVAVVTQSGGIGSYINNLAAARGEGLAVTISTGNESDIALGEAIEAVSQLEETRAVVAIVETVRDGDAFIDAIRSSLGRRIPVIACRIGTGTAAQTMMSTHTGAMAIPAKVFSDLLSALKVTVAETPAEAFDIASVVARATPPPGARIGIVTHSGGMAIHLADLAEQRGLDTPQPIQELVAKLIPQLDHGAPNNPLDMGAIIGGPGRFAEVVATFASSGDYDMVLAVTTAHPPADSVTRARSLIEIETPATVLHLWMAGDQATAGRELLTSSGAPLTEDPQSAAGALAALSTTAKHTERMPPDPIHSSFEQWGIPLVAGEVVENAPSAISAAKRIGYPVVVKAESPDLDHKTEAGGVRLDVKDDASVVAAFEAMTSIPSVERARIEKYRPGLEMIVGAYFDPVFGPVATVGVGGVLTEVIGDVVFAPAPVDEAEGMAMIEKLRARRILDGVRGNSGADVEGLARIVSLLSRGLVGSNYREAELNPVIWDGKAWVAVDWLLR